MSVLAVRFSVGEVGGESILDCVWWCMFGVVISVSVSGEGLGWCQC